MYRGVNVNVKIDRRLTQRVLERFESRSISRLQAVRMLMSEIVRKEELPFELRNTKEAKYFMGSGDKVQNTFTVDMDLKKACEAVLDFLRTDLATVITSFYVYVANTEESPFGVIQFMSIPPRACRELVPIDGRLMRKFNDIVFDKGLTVKDAIIAYIQQVVDGKNPYAGKFFSSTIVNDLLRPMNSVGDAPFDLSIPVPEKKETQN